MSLTSALCPFILVLLLSACQNTTITADLTHVPEISEVDKKYANIYQMLEGKWAGKFYIYKDNERINKDEIDLTELKPEIFHQPGLQLLDSIIVHQEYQSVTPYFQRVTITDYYPAQQKTVISRGVNKIEKGELVCIVIKPDDTVIHKGILESKKTIIWYRSEKRPQRKEYFRETVDADNYRIIGWGYYSGDDPELSPRLWFKGEYIRE